MERGLLPASLDLEISMALLLGPMLYRHIFTKGSSESNDDLGRQTAEAFCRAFVAWD
jgi:hypothetical protein